MFSSVLPFVHQSSFTLWWCNKNACTHSWISVFVHTIHFKSQTKPILPFCLLPASWRAKWLGQTSLTSLWPHNQHRKHCLLQEINQWCWPPRFGQNYIFPTKIWHSDTFAFVRPDYSMIKLSHLTLPWHRIWFSLSIFHFSSVWPMYAYVILICSLFFLIGSLSTQHCNRAWSNRCQPATQYTLLEKLLGGGG